MLNAAVKFLLLSEAFAVMTFAGGWSAVPVLGMLVGLFSDAKGRPVWWATVCAVTGWLELLLLDASRGPLAEVAARFGGVLGLPAVVVLALTLCFAALLAWSASLLGADLRRTVVSRRAQPAPAQHPAGTSHLIDAPTAPGNEGSAAGVAVADV